MGSQRAPLFVGAAALALAIMLVFFLVLPKMAQVSDAREELAAAKGEQQTLLVRQGALEDTKAQAPVNRQIIDHVHEQIPPAVDEAGLILLIHNAALDSGLDLSAVAAGAPTFDAATGLSVISLTVNAVGTYNEVTQFSYRIETLPRAAKITQLGLAPGQGNDSLGSPLLTMTASLEAYTSDASAGPGSDPGATEAGG